MTSPCRELEIWGKPKERGERYGALARREIRAGVGHYLAQMGLEQATTGYWSSPFDYGQQALLYVPKDMPEPNSAGYAASVAAAALPVIQASQGRAFVLCTSLRAMREVHALLKDAFASNGMEYPLLMQGDSARTEWPKCLSVAVWENVPSGPR